MPRLSLDDEIVVVQHLSPWARDGRPHYYCPTCGCVWPGWYSIIRQQWWIEGHGYCGPDMRNRPCKGGPIDPEKDRAP